VYSVLLLRPQLPQAVLSALHFLSSEAVATSGFR
jgi:hypothetical protein